MIFYCHISSLFILFRGHIDQRRYRPDIDVIDFSSKYPDLIIIIILPKKEVQNSPFSRKDTVSPLAFKFIPDCDKGRHQVHLNVTIFILLSKIRA